MVIKGSFPDDLSSQSNPRSRDPSSNRLNQSEEKVQSVRSSLPPLSSALPKLPDGRAPSRYSPFPADVEDELQKFNPFAEEEGFQQIANKGPIAGLKRREQALKENPDFVELPLIRKSPFSRSTSGDSSPTHRRSPHPNIALQRPNPSFSESEASEPTSNISSPTFRESPSSVPLQNEPVSTISSPTISRPRKLPPMDTTQQRTQETPSDLPELPRQEGLTKPPLPPIKPKNT